MGLRRPGRALRIDRVTLYWIARAVEGSVQVSTMRATGAICCRFRRDRAGGRPEVFASRRGPLRACADDAAQLADGYILSEIEVYGRGGFVARPKAVLPAGADGRLDLAGGACGCSVRICQCRGRSTLPAGFQDSGWLVATVPGTVLTSYLNVGAIPDPNFEKTSSTFPIRISTRTSGIERSLPRRPYPRSRPHG